MHTPRRHPRRHPHRYPTYTHTYTLVYTAAYTHIHPAYTHPKTTYTHIDTSYTHAFTPPTPTSRLHRCLHPLHPLRHVSTITYTVTYIASSHTLTSIPAPNHRLHPQCGCHTYIPAYTVAYIPTNTTPTPTPTPLHRQAPHLNPANTHIYTHPKPPIPTPTHHTLRLH